MAVTTNFSQSSLDLNGVVGLSQPTALVWGPDGRLYVTEVDGDVKVLTIAFGDKDPNDADPTAQFYVTDAVTLDEVRSIPNRNDNGTTSNLSDRQVTGIDVTPQYDAAGEPVLINGKPAVTIYVTSSDSRIGAGTSGADQGLDTNSGVITKLTQTGPNSWDAVDLVRGLARSEENHALNGLEVIQTLDADGKLVSERMIVANGGNANSGAPSNNFAGQQEQPYSGAILEVDLDMLAAMPVLTDPTSGRAYVYDTPTLDDPTRAGASDAGDPFGGNDGFNSAKLVDGGPVSIYSPGYRNAYDVEVTEDGRVFTYDNGANNTWGGRPVGEAGDNGGTIDFAQVIGYIATNLNNGDGNSNDDINLVNWNPSNKDQMHEVTRSDDLGERALSAGQGGARTYEDPFSGLTLVYGGHPNPTRAEGSRAGLLFSPGAGTDNAFLLVSDQDSFGNGGGSDYEEVVAWLAQVEADDARYPDSGIYGASEGELTSRVLAVTPGVLYDIYALTGGGGAAVVAGGPKPVGGTLLGQAGLPSDIAQIVARTNPIEGDYLEAGRTDGAIDTGNGSINGMAEYTSTLLDEGAVKMSGALISASLGGSLIITGRDADGVMQTSVNGQGFSVAADRTVLSSGGAPLGLAAIGDDVVERGLSLPFQGSIWSAVYKQNGPLIEIFQPANGTVPLAGSEIVDETDADLDGVDYIHDPFEFSADNGYALGAGERMVLDFSPLNDSFPTSFSSTGLLGAALDGVTPNQDAYTAAENFPADQQRPGLYDNAGNILPGGNAPIFQIKKVKDGTVVGTANSARDAMHTGIRPDPDVGRIVATVSIKNWIIETGTPQTGQLTGLLFGDGTQSNFLRVVFGGVEGFGSGIEVGYELGDAGYVVLARDSMTGVTNPFVDSVELRLEISDIGGDFDVRVAYRFEGRSEFTEVPLLGGAGFSLPQGVLRDVLTGDHTITSGGPALPSGAAVGLLAEDTAGDGSNDAGLRAIDFNSLEIEAFGNEIAADTAAEVGASGSGAVDTVIYTGTDTALAPLAGNVENFDGSRSDADYAVTGNALDNTIVVGSGANTIATGAGSDSVRGTLGQLSGDHITDMSHDDEVLINGVSGADLTVSYAAGAEPGSAVVTVNGASITFSGEGVEGFDPADGAATFDFEDAPGGVRLTTRPALTPVVAINAGGPDVPSKVLRDTEITFVSDGAGAPMSGFKLTGSSKSYSNATSTGTDFPATDLDAVLAYERSSASTAKWGYEIDVPNGTYLVDLIYAEIYHGFVTTGDPNDKRQFDVFVEGGLVEDDYDIIDDAGAAGTQVIRSYQVEVTDGALNIEFLKQVDQAKLSGLAVWAVNGDFEPPTDTMAPTIVSVSVENPQNVQDDERDATVVLSDEGGFDLAALEALDGSELEFSGIVPEAVSAPTVVLSDGGTTATLTYVLTPPDAGWPSGEGAVSLAAGAYADAAGNVTAATAKTFIFEPNLDTFVAGQLALAINVGPEAAGTDGSLDGADKSTYGGAITDDPIIGVSLQADDPSYYSPSSKTQYNIDGKAGSTGSNTALDGSALHTYRDSAAGSFTATYPIENGLYVVELWFAELFHATPKQRQGDYTINGQVAALNFDAHTAAGGADQPVKITKNVAVTDGQIVVDVNADTGQPGFNAIVIYEAVPSSQPPTVSVADVAAVEGEDAMIAFSRVGDLSQPVDVTFSLAPAGADASDFGAPSSFTVTIPAGDQTAAVAVPITDDDLEEGPEAFTVTIDAVSGNAQIGDATATVTIAASDAPEGEDAFEGVSLGDLSDDPDAPTDLGTLGLGDSVLAATQQGPSEPGGRDYDYVTFTVAEGQSLDQLILAGYDSGDPTNQGFLGLIEGTTMPAPPQSQAEYEALAAQLLGGVLMGGSGGLGEGADLLGEDGLASGGVQGQTTMDFEAPLGAGTYTLWFSQGGAPSTTTLQFKVSEVTMATTLSIAAAPSVVEGGDDGVTTLAFPLTASGGFEGDITVSFDAGDGAQSQVVAFTGGTGTLSIDVPQDDADTGGTTVTVTLTGADAGGEAVTLGTATASGTVTEDDGAAPQKGELAFALNVGGKAVTATDGTVYAADDGTGWSGSATYAAGAGTDFDGDGDADADDAVYSSERYGGKGAATMTYVRDGLAPGDYVLTLKFAEIFGPAYVDNNRVFDVRANTVTVVDDLDLVDVRDAAFEAYDVEVPVTVGPDGTLTLEFDASSDNAKVNAIALHKAAVAAGSMVVSIADASANEADGTVAVTVSRTGDLSEAVAVSFTVSDGTATAGFDYTAPAETTITIPASAASASIVVPIVQDDMEEPSEAFTVAITGAVPQGTASATIGASTATVTIADDDQPPLAAGTAPDEDLDGDGIANATDPDVDGDGAANEAETFRYDATDAGQALSAGQSVTLDFGTPGTPWQNGLTGALVSSKATVSEVDLANAAVADGALTVTATPGDHFGGNNTQQNAFVAAFSAAEGLRVETRFAAPDFNPGDTNPQTPSKNYQSAGVVLGTDQDTMVKAVFGRSPSAKQLELAQDGGAQMTTALPAGFDYAQVAAVVMALETFIDAGAAKARATATFLGADDQPLAGLDAVSMGEITLTGGLANLVLAGAPLGAGVIQTSTQSGANFDVAYDSLTVTALGEASGVAEIAIAAGPTVAEGGDDGATALVFTLSTTGPDGPVTVDYTVEGAPQTAEVNFSGGVGTLSVAVSNDDFASGDATRTVTLTGVSGDAALGSDLTATGTVTEDDFAPVLDQGVEAQAATAGQAFAFSVPADAFADADSALTLTATLADGSDLPAWLSFDGSTFSGTPGAGDAGMVSVLVTASDGSNPPVTASFDLNVGASTNTAPTTAPIDAGTALETADPVVIDLLANAADADGDTLAVTNVSAVDGGGFAVDFTIDGASITIDPDALADFVEEGESATVTVTYDVVDGQGGVTPGSATLVIEGVDDALVWYLDADGDGFGSDDNIVMGAEQPAGYVAEGGDPNDADPTVYPGAPEINDGQDNDGDGDVDENNVAPTVSADGATVASNAVLAIGAAELLANDIDLDGDTLTVTGVGNALNGTVSLSGGVVSFTPAPGFVGQATFDYTVEDGFGGSDTGTVTVDVTPADATVETPLALGAGTVTSYGSDVGSSGQDRTGPEGAEVSGSDVTLRGNAWKAIVLPEPITIAEGAKLRFDYSSAKISEIVGIGLDDDALAEDAGTAIFQIAGTQNFFTADQTYRSYTQPGTTASFEIDLSAFAGQTFDRLVAIHDQDRDPASSVGTFSNVRIVAPAGGNTAPEASGDTAQTASGAALVIPAADLLANDADDDGDALSVIAVSNATNGTVELAGGQVTFTPADGFVGAASFDYTVSDGNGGLDTATVSVTVTEPDDGSVSTPIAFSAGAIQSYGDQDTTPGAGFEVGDGGASLRLIGNTWKKIALPAGTTITEDTVLRFDMTLLGSAGEIIGIGLETDDDFRTPGDALFQLVGRQNFGSQSSRVYFGQTAPVGEAATYEIDLGAFAGQSFSSLVFLADDDRDAAIDVRFSDVTLVEPGDDTGGGTGGAAPTIFGGAIPDMALTEDTAFEIPLPITDADTPQTDLTFTFEGLPAFVTVTDGLLTGTPTNDDVGTYTVTVTAADPEGNTVSDTFDLSVADVNDAPEVTGALPDRGAVLGAAFSMALPSGVFTDVDAGEVLTYTATGLPEGVSIDPATGAISGTPTQAGTFTVSVTATDQEAEFASTDFELTVASGPPREEIVIEAEDFTGLGEPGGVTNFYTEFASSASGSQVVRLGNGQSGSVSTDLGAAGLVPGTYDLVVRAYDENDGASTLRVLIDRADGSGPELLQEFTLDATGLPGQGNATQAGNLRDLAIPGVGVTAGARLIIEGTAQGGEFLRTDLVRFTPVDAPLDAPPSFSSPAALSVVEGVATVGDVVATDPEGEGVSYAIAGGADADLFAINAATGALTFTAAPDFEAPADAGGNNVYDVVVSASDGAVSATQAIAITVTDGGEGPAISGPATVSVAENQTAVAAYSATDPDGSAITFSIAGGADAGAFTIDPGTGVLSFASAPDFEAPGDAGSDGTYDVVVGASDADGTDTIAVAVTVTDANDAPEATGASVPSATAGSDVSVDLSALFADQDGDALAYALVDADGSGLTLAGDALTGTPAAGTYSVTVSASDGGAPVETTFTLEVTDDGSGGGTVGGAGLDDDLDGDGIANSADGDIDGDTVANLDDRAAYDDDNQGVVLANAGEIVIDFTTLADGASPFEASLTGVAQTANGSPELDYATNSGAVVNGGRLEFQTTNDDTNNGDSAFTFLAEVGGDFVYEGVFDNPVFGASALSTFSQYGLIISMTGAPGASTGTGGDFVKLVTGNPGNGFEISGKGSVSGETKVGYPAGVSATEFAQVKLTLAADAGTATLTGSYELLDGAGQVIGSGTVGTVSASPGSALFDALTGAGGAADPAFGVTSTDVGGGGAFTVSVESLRLAEQDDGDTGGGTGGGGNPGEPTNALEAFAAQGDLDTSQSYGGGAVGAAKLEIMTGVSDIDASNYGQNSFQVTNLGDKKISAIFIDVTEALYPDSVFDPDGKGGDNAAKPWAVNNAGGTGGYVDGTGYFLPGVDPLSNTTGTGIASNGGFKGAMVKFDPSVSGGFQTGETVGFSGDMDPNSIAGLNKSGTAGVDTGAVSGWDVGGISGHELIGSSFTVLFDDGTTAMGELMSDKSASGSHALATQAGGASAPGLTVGGVAAGGTGTYGGTAPSVIVTGTPGETVRITLTKGLDPVTNTTGGIDALVANRLDRYDFKVSNNFDSQSVDVKIGANGRFDATKLFDYDDAPANNKADFTGSDTAPIGFVASVINGQGVPISPVTAPIYLTNQGGPVAGDPTGTGQPEGYFSLIGSGSTARFKVQIEDANANGGQDPGGKWQFVDAPDAQGKQAGFQGDGYYLFGSTGSTAINGVNTSEVLNYTIYVPEGETGTYTFRARVSRDGVAASDQQNDLFLNFKAQGTNESFADYAVLGSNVLHQGDKGYAKIYGGPNNGSWGFANKVDGEPNDPVAKVTIDEPGFYTVQIAGRSQGYHVDFWELYKGGTPSTGGSNSAFVPTGDTAPTVVDPIEDVSLASGAGGAIGTDGTFRDLDGDALTLSATIPAAAQGFVSFDAGTGVFTVAPGAAAGAYTLGVSATDDDGNTASDSFQLTVAAAPPPQPAAPVLTFQVLDTGKAVVDALLESGDSYTLAQLGSAPEFTGTFASGSATSVVLQILDGAGKVLDTQVENLAPWDITYEGSTPLAAGGYTLKATTHSGSSGSGTKLGEQTFAFSIADGTTGGGDTGGGDTGGGDTGGGDTGGGDTGGGTGGTGGTTELVFATKASADDWEQFGNATSSDLEFGFNGSNAQTVGIRFPDVTIPDGAVIERAFLRFEADGSDGGPASFVIEIEGSENAASYKFSSKPDSRSYVDSFVWSDVEDWADGGVYETPDVSDLIETVIGSDGIDDGALGFRISGAPGNAGARAAHAWNSTTGAEPELVILLDPDSLL